ncbi:MAG: hypothetical protein ACT4OS_09365 [Acidimicrobiales bacterium]
MEECRSDQALADGWHSQAQALGATLDELNAWRQGLVGHTVVLPEEGLPSKAIIEEMEALRDRLAAGKGVSKMLQREMHALHQRCEVDGEPPRSAADMELCLTEARTRRREYEFETRWSQTVGRVLGPRLDPGTHIALIGSQVRGLQEAVEWAAVGWPNLRGLLLNAGITPPLSPSPLDLHRLEGALAGALSHFKERTLDAELAGIRSQLVVGQTSHAPSALWNELLEAFDTCLIGRWEAVRVRARHLRALVGPVAELDRFHNTLASVAPIWAQRIIEHRADPTRVGSVAAAADAWTWRQAETWLQGILSGDDPATLQRQLEGELVHVQRATAQLAARSAWLCLAERLTDKQRQALTAWAQALKKSGRAPESLPRSGGPWLSERWATPSRRCPSGSCRRTASSKRSTLRQRCSTSSSSTRAANATCSHSLFSASPARR